MSYKDLIFAYNKINGGIDLFVKKDDRPGRGFLFASIRDVEGGKWDSSASDEGFAHALIERTQTCSYRNKGFMTLRDMLFIAKVAYILHYHEEEVGDIIEHVEEAFIHGTRQDVERALEMEN